jgi:predicted transcriptional regulator
MEPFECESLSLSAEDIMTRGVVSVGLDASVLDVITLMHDKNISSVAVVDNESRYFTISHSEIINFIFRNPNHAPFSEINVKEIMKGPVDTFAPETSIDEIVHQMQNQGLKRVLIADPQTKKLIGIITTHDLMIWNSNILKRSIPILLLVIENESGLLLAKHIFKEEINIQLLDLFSGSLSAVDSILQEVTNEKGAIKTIQKEYFTILLERTEYVTAVLIVDHSSIDIRRRLQDFVKDFCHKYQDDLQKRKAKSGPIDHFDLSNLIEKFRFLNKF